jgi:exodeoxyribonuclease V alpha subunit
LIPKTSEISLEGVVERVTFESATSSYRIIKLAVAGRADRLAVVGSFPPTPVGARVRVRGVLEQDRKHGEQLRVESLIELAPDTLGGLERYLASGLIKGVGPKLAQRIVATFGLDALRVLEEDVDRLREVEGLGEKRRAALARAWREQRSLRDVMVFLQAHGASPALAARIVRRYGPNAMNIVSREPFRLALDVRGVGFKTADRIAAAIGVLPDSPERMQAGALQVVHDLTDAGHTWTAHAEVVARAATMLGLDASESNDLDEAAVHVRIDRALDACVRIGRVVLEDAPESDAGRVVFASEMHAAEQRLAARLAELASARPAPLDGVAAAITDFESRARVELAPEQRSAVEEAARRQVLVVTGGPGVGKTTIVRAILAALVRAGIVVRLAAPTGRAAKRLSDTTGAEATTLHRLLDFDPKSATFKRDRHRPIEAGAVVVDEASMLDLPTADSLAQAIAPGTRLLLVGDVDQLPSVGPGAVLRDVIASDVVPCVRLRQIFRQAARSLIVTNAHRINEGEMPVSGAPGDPAGSAADFFIVERRDPERARATVIELVTSRIPDRFGLDPVRDIQVLTPMNRGPAGAVALNQALQEALNPTGVALVRGARTFRVGDKVMQLRNDYDKNVYNGDVGLVASIDPEEVAMTVRFDGRDVAFEASDLDDLVLAYACTVHKSQGSEYPAVVIPLLTTHFVMLSKNLLYTAVTRGKRLVVLVCDPRALTLALSTGRPGAGDGQRGGRDEARRTRLAVRLRERLPGRWAV